MFEARKNEKSRKEIIELARKIKDMKNSNISIADKMESIVSLLSDNSPNTSKEAVKIDAEIKLKLKDISGDIQNGKLSLASRKCENILELIKKRNSSRVKGKDLDYGNDASVEFDIVELTEQRKSLLSEYGKTKSLFQREPTNAAYAAKLKSLNLKINTIDQKIKVANVTMSLIEQGASAEEITAYIKESTGKAPSSEDLALIKSKLEDARGHMETMTQEANELDELLNNTEGQTQLFDASSGVEGADLYAQMFPDEAGKSASKGASAPTAKSGNNSDSAEATVDAIYSESEKMLEQIEDADEEYSDQISEANQEIERESKYLRNLLTKRKSATPAQCLALDSDIRKHKANLVRLQNRIKTLAQAREYNNELSIAIGAARDQNDIKGIKNLIDRNSEFLKDPEKAALAIKALKEANNEEIDLISAVNSVIGSTDIDESALSSSRISNVDLTSSGKNDDEFADLEQLLGMRE